MFDFTVVLIATFLLTLMLYVLIYRYDIRPYASCYERDIGSAYYHIMRAPSAWLMLILHAAAAAYLWQSGQKSAVPLLIVIGAIGISDWLTRYVPSFRVSLILAVVTGSIMLLTSENLIDAGSLFNKAMAGFMLVLFANLVAWIGIERRGHLGDIISFAPFALLPESIGGAIFYAGIWVLFAFIHGIWQRLSQKTWMYPDATARWHAALVYLVLNDTEKWFAPLFMLFVPQ